MKSGYVAALALALVQMAECWSTYHGIVGATDSETYTAEGRAGYTIHCDGALLSWETCSAKAGELCETRGYDVLEKHTWGFLSSGPCLSPASSNLKLGHLYRQKKPVNRSRHRTNNFCAFAPVVIWATLGRYAANT